MPKKQTSIHKFLTEVLDDNWRAVHISPDEMRKNVEAHNKRFGAAGWIWIEVRSHSKGCEARKASRDGREG